MKTEEELKKAADEYIERYFAYETPHAKQAMFLLFKSGYLDRSEEVYRERMKEIASRNVDASL